jgi:hypothetical protein
MTKSTAHAKTFFQIAKNKMNAKKDHFDHERAQSCPGSMDKLRK